MYVPHAPRPCELPFLLAPFCVLSAPPQFHFHGLSISCLLLRWRFWIVSLLPHSSHCPRTPSSINVSLFINVTIVCSWLSHIFSLAWSLPGDHVYHLTSIFNLHLSKPSLLYPSSHPTCFPTVSSICDFQMASSPSIRWRYWWSRKRPDPEAPALVKPKT